MSWLFVALYVVVCVKALPHMTFMGQNKNVWGSVHVLTLAVCIMDARLCTVPDIWSGLK